MATTYKYKPCPPFYMFLTLLISTITFPYTSCQLTSSQNIETFYPSPPPSPVPVPAPNSPVLPPTRPAENSTPPPTPLPPASQKPSSSNRTIATAVAATAAGTFAVATLLFFAIQRYSKRRKGDHVNPYSDGRPPRVISDRFTGVHGDIKGLIVDETGLDAVYWKKLRGQNNRDNGLRKEVLIQKQKAQSLDVEEEQEEEGVIRTRNGKRKPGPRQQVSLLLGKSSGSNRRVVPEIEIPDRAMLPRFGSSPSSAGGSIGIKAVEKPSLSSQPSMRLPPPPRPQPMPLAAPPVQTSKAIANTPPPPKTSMAISNKQGPAPPPPSPPKTSMALPNKQGPAPPKPPPLAVPGKKGQTMPSQEPAGEVIGQASEKETGESSTGEGGAGQVKLKPVHGDKVNKNVDHSMVWDNIDNDSFR